MNHRDDLTSKYVRSILHYDQTTGVFTWRGRVDAEKKWNARFPGKRAGHATDFGYWRICINSKGYKAHRLAWLYVYGEWPLAEVDHKNGNPLDNRIANLREASSAENKWNARKRRDNTSGLKGVSWDGQRNRWRAQIAIGGEHRFLGRFDTAESAYAVYCAAAQTMHGEFARTS